MLEAILTPQEILEAMNAALAAGRPVALISLISRDSGPLTGIAKLLVDDAGHPCGGSLGSSVLDAAAVEVALSVIADEKLEIMAKDLGEVRVLIEVSRPPLELIVCGGGHVGRAVAAAGRLLDFRVTVIDDRDDFASRERFQDGAIRPIAGDFTEVLRGLRITPATHVVIVTRGHRHDEICLREVIAHPARYVGMIGSRRRTTTIRERLKKEGIAPELLRRVHAPIGLDIGAQTPEEIAFAILSEIVLVRRGGTGLKKSAEGPMAKAR
ncbi:MAG: XdhC/CoxI family protein [Acidobacteriota bacterium]